MLGWQALPILIQQMAERLEGEQWGTLEVVLIIGLGVGAGLVIGLTIYLTRTRNPH